MAYTVMYVTVALAVCVLTLDAIQAVRRYGRRSPAHADHSSVVARVAPRAAAEPAPTSIAPAPSHASAPSAPAASSAPSAEAPAAPSSWGEVALPLSAIGHRIFVDGRLVGESLRSLRLACGRHAVRVGSAGITRPVDVPCGGEVSFQ
jgi:hypothetical protein